MQSPVRVVSERTPVPGLRAGGDVLRWLDEPRIRGRVLRFTLCASAEVDDSAWCSAQPWRCLWRRFSQITMTRPLRRITLHLSQIFLTLG